MAEEFRLDELVWYRARIDRDEGPVPPRTRPMSRARASPLPCPTRALDGQESKIHILSLIRDESSTYR
jgi:hypothetical protein